MKKWFKTNTNGSWPDNVLNEELRSFYNPIGELNASNLIDINTGNSERSIRCSLFNNIQNSEITFFPKNIIDNLYVNNGISAANTIDEARIEAILQICEFHIQSKVVAEGLSLPDIPVSLLKNYPEIESYISEVKNAGYELLIKDASLKSKYPVIAIVVLNPENQGLIACFSAHPTIEIALQRSFYKLFAKRQSCQFDDSVEAGFDMDEIASPSNLENHFNNSKGILSWKFLNENKRF